MGQLRKKRLRAGSRRVQGTSRMLPLRQVPGVALRDAATAARIAALRVQCHQSEPLAEAEVDAAGHLAVAFFTPFRITAFGTPHSESVSCEFEPSLRDQDTD